MSNVQIFTSEEKPIFQYESVNPQLILDSIDDILTLNPRLVIFNKCKITDELIKKLSTSKGPYVFYMDAASNCSTNVPFLKYTVLEVNSDVIDILNFKKVDGYVLKIDNNNYEKILNLIIKGNFKNKVMISPIVYDPILGIGPERLDQIYHVVSEYNKKYEIKINVSHNILPTRLFLEHPCNAYMLSECKCHMKKHDVPRHIVILSDGSMLPYDAAVDERYIIGNISQGINNTIEKYRSSKEHNYFLKVCREMFFSNISKTSFAVISWGELFVKYSADSIF